MRNRFIKFMYGRYGVDELSTHLLILTIAISLTGTVLRWFNTESSILAIISLSLSLLSTLTLAYIIFRTFSKNINRRVMENHKYLARTEKIRTYFKFTKTRFNERKTYKYLKCPSCKSYSRVPKGKGKIKITCRVCKKQFTKKV